MTEKEITRRFQPVSDWDEYSVFDHQLGRDLFPTKSGNRDYSCKKCDFFQANQIADAMEVYHLTLREKELYDNGDKDGAENCRRQVYKLLFT